MLRKPLFWILLLAGLLVASVGAAVLQQRSPAAAAPAVANAPALLEFLPGDLTEVQPRELRQIMLLSGALRAVSQAQVRAKVAGEVRAVLVREGEPVQAGQVLARIDATDYQARLEQATAGLQSARAQLSIAAKARDTNKALVNQGFISQNAFDNASSQYEIAVANVNSAKGALNLARNALSDTVIRAPISGLVASRSVQPGEKVSPDSRLLEVVDLRQMELEAAVPTTDIRQVAPGQQVQVRLEGAPASMTGRVARINPAIQPGSRSVLVYIRIDNPQGLLKAGMFGEAQLILAQKPAVLAVPQSALQYRAGAPFVYAVENGRLQPKPVTPGIQGHDGEHSAVEIVSGLQPGALIVRRNLGSLPAGIAVRLAAPAPAATATTAGAPAPATRH